MVKSLKEKRKSTTRFALGTARSGKHQYINRMGKAEREKRLAEIHEAAEPDGGRNRKPRAAFSRAEWKALRSKLAEDEFMLFFHAAG